MRFGNAVDDDVHEGAITDEIRGNLVEVGRQHMDLFLDNGSSRHVLFFSRMAGGDDVAVAQVKAGAAHQNLARFVRRALILRIFKNSDGRQFGAIQCRSIKRRGLGGEKTCKE